MRENRSYGSVGERGGNEPLYPEASRRKRVRRWVRVVGMEKLKAPLL